MVLVSGALISVPNCMLTVTTVRGKAQEEDDEEEELRKLQAEMAM